MIDDLMIGGLSGVVSRTCTAPFELLKIQKQNDYIPNTTIKDVIKYEGIKGLWKGNFTNCVRIFPQIAINYSIYNYCRNNIFLQETTNNINKNTIINKDTVNFISGAISGSIAMIAIYPLENIRSRLSLQSNKQYYNGICDSLRKIKFLHLYKGLNMSLIGFTPYNALNFTFYHSYNRNLDIKNKELNKLLCGGLSGISAVSFTYPTDLIRRRLQIQNSFDKDIPKYNGIIDCIKKIYKQEGIKGFYKGLIPCYLKIFPAMAIQFWCFDNLSKWIKN